ncbi:MAG: hypothetical protein H8E27_15315 [Verrucomicrobia subdivision 3 bacterium]|nr:hypothetical protein [Limisphaerales bacterium]
MKPALSAIALPETQHRSWWLWPNLLSLDAPVVALVWQEAFAAGLAVDLGWTQRALLAVCVWLAYCGDRLLDARRLPEGAVDSPRHAFARDHSTALTVAWCVGLALATVLALQMSAREMLVGAGLLTVLGGYFLLHHVRASRERAGRWKELMAGVCFAAGTLFFVVLNLQIAVPVVWGSFVLAALAWGGLCVINCLVIAGWDRESDAAMKQPSLARRWAGMERALPMMALGLVGMILGATVLDDRWVPLALALAASALALLELARRPNGGSAEARRVWADAVLLTPLLVLV